MNLKTRLAKLESHLVVPTAGGVATLQESGRVSYRGRSFPSVEALPHGGYLVVPQAVPVGEWERRAREQQAALLAKDADRALPN